MKIPREARQEAKRLFRACLRENGRVDETLAREVVKAVVEIKPRNYIPLLQYFYNLVENAIRAHSVTIESAAPLADNGASVNAQLEERYGPSTSVNYKVRPDLIGGVRVIRGSVIWDNSVLGRIDSFRQAFEIKS